MNIPIFELKRQYKSFEKEAKKKLDEILESQAFILGKEVEAFERAVASYCNVKFAIGLNSGTDALILALDAIGVGEGDEVITSSFTFVATAEAIARVGAKPVFVDIEPKTFNIDPELIKKKITKKTKAIIPVHMYGLPANMDEIKKAVEKKGIKVIEDSAQAIGATYNGKKTGSLADCGCFSFFPSKNLGGFGDGGMIVTDSEELYEKIKLLRNHGTNKKYHHKIIGYNSRLDNLQAAILNVKLPLLDGWIKARQENAELFNSAFKEYPLVVPSTPKGCGHSYHLYTLKYRKPEKISEFLNTNGIEARTYYPLPLHMQECFKHLGYKKGDLPEAERACTECFSIPAYPELTGDEKSYIIDKFGQFFSK